uniref:IBH1-like N-terminal domain-containing protein n=1 Tax=Leersia perrieri TaxID=77586 RepID=A0A0D9WSR4_9ORYZ
MEVISSSTKAPFEQAFLKNLLLILQDRSSSTPFHAMSLHDRKLAVKSSADIAMAAARGGGARWPKAILPPATTVANSCKAQRCRRIIVRSKRLCGGNYKRKSSMVVVRRRTMALRKVVPGGDAIDMDEASLLREAMDYVVHLQAQVDVLRRVSEVVQAQSTSDLRCMAMVVIRDPGFVASIMLCKAGEESMDQDFDWFFDRSVREL